ncbi:hypothetical protein ACHAXS_010122 [Conticribra weissflogii]
MANSVAVAIEDERPHEIYADLLVSPSSSRRRIIDNSKTKRAIGHIVSSNRCVAARSSLEPPTVIVEGDVDDDRVDHGRQYRSQFMSFYRKSCQSCANPPNCNETKKNKAGDDSKSADMVCLKTNPSANPHTTKRSTSPRIPAESQKKTTKAERRRIAQRERERTIRREKRIRVMLSSDFSDEYQQIYSRLHRY